MACDTGWQYIGHPPSEILGVIQDPGDPERLYTGTYRVWDDPTTGGVFTHIGDDTVWQYAGLMGTRVFRLAHFPFCRPSIFAATSTGLYSFMGDTNWTLITRVGTTMGEQQDFAISPHDTSLWLISNHYVGSGSIFLSRNSGQTWNYYYTGYVTGDLLFSRVHENACYFTEFSLLRRVDLQDSTVQTVMELWPGISDVVYHPQEMWLYVGSLEGIARYDELTGDSIYAALPAGVQTARSIAYAENDGLYMSTSEGIYRVSDDLMTWQACEDTVETLDWKIYFVSSTVCVAGQYDRLYSKDRQVDVTPRPESGTTHAITVRPNPCHGFLIIKGAVGGRIEIFDLLGRLVEKAPLTTATVQEIDLKTLPTGIYFYRLVNERALSNASATGKIFILK